MREKEGNEGNLRQHYRMASDGMEPGECEPAFKKGRYGEEKAPRGELGDHERAMNKRGKLDHGPNDYE